MAGEDGSQMRRASQFTTDMLSREAHSPSLPDALHAPVALNAQPLLGGATRAKQIAVACVLAAAHTTAHRSRSPLLAQDCPLGPEGQPTLANAQEILPRRSGTCPRFHCLGPSRWRAAATTQGHARPLPLLLAVLVTRDAAVLFNVIVFTVIIVLSTKTPGVR